MSLDILVKDLVRDVEKLKEKGVSSEIIDEILSRSEKLTFSDSLALGTANKKTLAEIISLAGTLGLNSNQKSFSEALSFSDSLANTPQNSGTFLVGTAKVGFADCA